MSGEKSSERDSLFRDVPYEYGAIAPAGAILFTAGACPLDSEGNVVGPSDPVLQAGAALHNLIAAMARFGAGRRTSSRPPFTSWVIGATLLPCGM